MPGCMPNQPKPVEPATKPNVVTSGTPAQEEEVTKPTCPGAPMPGQE